MIPIPKMLSDAKRKLAFVPALLVPSAPTVAEVTATGALDISCLVKANNFALGAAGEDTVNDPALCARGNDSAPGRVNYTASMEFFRWTTTVEDKAWTTFTESGIGGFLVQRIGQDFEEPFAVGDEVQVYEVLTGTPRLLTPDGGRYEGFALNFYVQSGGTDERAVIAA
ncbi:hypothetical protein [Blastococcus xanthinilyticus]|nr:hypothetical protein [Blastococcus xanthinilyticus]